MEYTTADVDRAADQFRGAESKLLRQDGTPVYGPEEHAERRAALFETFDHVAEDADSAASAQIAEAERTLFAIENRNVMDALSEAELTRASVRETFVAKDAARLPLAEVAAQCRLAMMGGDKALQYLWLRAGHERGQAVLATVRDHADGLPQHDAEVLRELDGVLKELDGALADPHAASKKARAEATIKAARAVKAHAGTIHAELSGAKERTEQRLRARYGL